MLAVWALGSDRMLRNGSHGRSRTSVSSRCGQTALCFTLCPCVAFVATSGSQNHVGLTHLAGCYNLPFHLEQEPLPLMFWCIVSYQSFFFLIVKGSLFGSKWETQSCSAASCWLHLSDQSLFAASPTPILPTHTRTHNDTHAQTH